MSSVAIISGRFPQTTFDSSINHKAYADVFGFDYIHCNWPTKAKNLYLNKINYILHYIKKYDYIIWIDDDAFFFDFEKNILDFAPVNDSFISLCKSPDFKPLKTFFSSGQFILKCNSLSQDFLQAVLEQDLTEVKNWWKPELGFFTNGDQDSMVYLLLEDDRFKASINLYNYKAFNSRFENLKLLDIHKPLILHFTGKAPIKQANYLETQKTYQLHSSLVPKTILEPYNIVYPVSNAKKSFFRRLKAFIKSKL
jgi:hypothetical protein